MDSKGVAQISYQISTVTLVAIVVGGAASLAAIGFVDAVHYLNERLLISPYVAIAAMVSVVFANLISYRVIGRSLFDLQLRARGFDLSLGRDKAILQTHQIRDYLSTEYTAAPDQDTVGDIRQCLVREGRAEAMVLDRQGRLLGVIRLQGIVNSAAETPATEAMIRSFTRFDEKTSVWQSMELLRGFLGEAVPLVNRNGELLGVVPEEAVIRAYLEIVHNLREEENEAA
jgi:chloride channel protein, CIC family